ncbi:hypothetical protein KL921_004593 [Ogataea angusta]|nr:hypothetical protein KL921_004593 [Ogataea angusta]KAG7821507.1 hypothetical protein KL909_004394 [Ogataea angusta]KAG7827247.1 hypothetical protein KL920_004907 [Ogataea angusta]KAG7829333.1 hypothetical protein KL943_005346 [Ogataea angusta]KAG7855003.1 hypothetical protein KL939_004752 [Ogataea angusta]
MSQKPDQKPAGGLLAAPHPYRPQGPDPQYIVNVLNLPRTMTRVDLEELLEPLAIDLGAIGSVQIYEMHTNGLSVASLGMDDYDTAARIVGRLDGYEYYSVVLQCHMLSAYQPQIPAKHGVAPFFPTIEPMPAPMAPFIPYYTYGMPVPRQRSVSFPYAEPAPATSAAPPHNHQPRTYRSPKKYPGKPRQRVELGNNYSSILNPDFDEDGSASESESSVDDNERPAEQLVQYTAAKYVSPTRLFVGNIPFHATYLSVLNFLNSGRPKIVQLYLKTQPSGVSKGFAIAQTTSLEDSVELIEKFHGARFQGRSLVVRFDKLPKLVVKSHNIKKRKNMEKRQLDEKENEQDQPDGPSAGQRSVGAEKQVAQELVLAINNMKVS